MHGKTSEIHHEGAGILAEMPQPFTATRYHSLIVREPLPPELIITATTDQGEIMSIRHRSHPTFGVQFHPESILTPQGKQLLHAFLALGEAERTEVETNGH
jgi:anthranilate synthase/aminodeoxychorismate synthase-like glutamine amidotransferase